jgi:uncharacterized membrane protein HdeD (DUF308 family)
MSRSANVSNAGISLSCGLGELCSKTGWIVALGVVYCVAGVIGLRSVVLATVVSVAIVGAMMLLAGAVEVIGAFRSARS